MEVYEILESSRILEKNWSDSVDSIASVDGTATLGAKPSAGTVMARFGSRVCTAPAFKSEV